MILAIIFAAFAAYLGYWIGVRRERGAHERVAELEEQKSFEDFRRSGVRLRTIKVRR